MTGAEVENLLAKLGVQPAQPQPQLVDVGVARLLDLVEHLRAEIEGLRDEVEGLRFEVELERAERDQPGRLSRAWSRVRGWFHPDPDTVIEHDDEPEDSDE